jgi:glycosyltransferase involved in cell wall biosynthesis
MKVGVLIDELVSGGFQKVAIMEVKYLNELGYDASLVVLHRIKNEGYQDLIKKNDIRTIWLSDRLPFFLKLNFRFPFFAFFSFFHVFYPIFIWRYIKRDNFDFFIAHGTYTAFSSIAIKRKLKIPFVSFIHDSVTYIIENKYKTKFSKDFLNILVFMAKKIDTRIIKNSDFVFAFPDMIMEMKKVFPEYPGYKAIFNGCEVLPEDKINFDKSNFAISVTKWDQGKNFDFLLDLWSKLDVKVPLKIIGSFHPVNLKEKMQKSINENKLDNVVELVGKVTEEELYGYYKNAKFMVHPCREAFGMTILEASASGCPAIFTNNSGVSALYTDLVKNILPPENDPGTYKKMITKLIQLNQEEYENLVREYYTSAKNNSWPNHCRRIMEVINHE